MDEKFSGSEDKNRNGNGNRTQSFYSDSGGRFIFNKGALIITSGIYYNFVREALRELEIDDLNSIYSPALTYPLNVFELLKAFNSHNYEKIIFAEDLEGFLEIQASWFIAHNKIKADIFGKNKLNSFGELKYPALKQMLRELLCRAGSGRIINVNETKNIIGHKADTGGADDTKGYYLQPLPREGTFCPGCAHRAFFYTLNKYISEYDVIGGDIGCSSLPPHFSSWLSCMNSGTSIASGISLSIAAGHSGQSGGKKQRTVSIIGDSTFFHSGLQTIMQCAASNSDQICFILDNGWTAMTGHQPTFTTKPLNGGARAGQRLSIKKILEAFGVKHIFEIDPFRVDKFKALLNELSGAQTDAKNFTAVIIKRECRIMAKKRSGEKNKKIEGRGPHKTVSYHIINQRCVRCNECYSVLSCPAVFKDDDGELYINQDICDGCGICCQICPNGAIVRSEVEYGG